MIATNQQINQEGFRGDQTIMKLLFFSIPNNRIHPVGRHRLKNGVQIIGAFFSLAVIPVEWAKTYFINKPAFHPEPNEFSFSCK